MNVFAAPFTRAPLGATLLLIAASATAAAPTETLNKYACSGCHGVDKRVVGPGFNEVAAKYKDQKDGKAHLVARIRSGGTGLWGQIPMPPQPAITDAELASVADWLMAGAKP